MENQKIFSTTINILVNHLNYGNHLGYDSVLSILQEARMRWLKTINPALSEINIQDGVGWMVREAHLIYDSEAHHGDELKIDLFVCNATKTSFTLEYKVENETTEKKLCSATMSFICFNFANSKIARIPNILLDAFKVEHMSERVSRQFRNV